MVALLGSAQWLKLVGSTDRSVARVVGTLCLLTMIPLPVTQLVRAAQGVPFTTAWGVSIGNLTKLNAGQLEQRRRFAAWVETLPKPLWIRDAMLQMPWFATNGQYPGFVLNEQFEADAAAKGVLEGAGFAEWIRRRHFACLLLTGDDSLAETARAAGYVEAPLPSGFAGLPSEFGIDRPAPRLWLRTDPAR
jgi:hypothetical protein